MNNIKQIQPLELIVMRDNEPDPEFRRKQQIEAVQAGLHNVLHTITAPVTNALHNARLNLTEDIQTKTYDLFNGTTFNEQLHKQRSERRQAVAAKRFKLL